MRNASLLSRVLDKCILNTDTGCLEHQGSGGRGYSQISVNNVMQQSHRLVWECTNNQYISEGLVIRHTCDNKKCCNPTHLIIGTQQENLEDRNERHPSYSTKEEREVCRNLHKEGLSQRQIANKMSRSQSTINSWLRRKTMNSKKD